MLQLLKVEWLKLKNYRTFWILMGLYMASIYGINFIVFRIQQRIFEEKQSKGMVEMLVGNPPYSFPTVWQMTAFVSSFLLFLPGLLMIIFITNEFSYKTHRQNIIDGWSRKQFISVKIVVAVIIALISTIMVFLTASSFGLQGANSFSLENIKYLGYFFLQATSYSLVAVLIAVLVRRGGLAIGIYFLYVVVIENVLKVLMNRYLDDTGRYLPLQSSDELIPAPVFENIQRQFNDPPNYSVLLIVVAVYLILYIFFINRKFLTSDL